ncbi:MAG: ABC transporter ATP-binding protein, partial [Alphaproteobacteria bacterium]|nr:ABC transporter ATP-binding protein [Alphaproteobacteria bacterium]
DVGVLLLLLFFIYSYGIVLNLIENIIRGNREQIFNRYKLYVLYKRIYENDMAFFLDKPSGQIISQSAAVNGKIHSLMDGFWAKFIGIFIGFLLIVGSLWQMNIWFVIILLSYGAIKILWEWAIQQKIKTNASRQMEEDAKYDGLLSDSVNNAFIVKYFANTEYENKYVYNGRSKLISLAKNGYFLSRLRWLPTNILWVSVRMFMLILCFYLIKSGDLSLSNAVFVMTSAAAINNAFAQLNREMQTYSKDLAAAKKAYENLIQPINITDKQNAKKLVVKNATIDFNNVDFGYGKNQVFKNFNLSISGREKVGVVGLSGAGKTTLCNLILRMYDVNGGSIHIDGHDIRDVKQESLLKQISFVPQETSMFNRSIYENIKYAKPHATRAEVISAAKKANIHDFIKSLPNGYDTLVGNNGIKLSGGQRQRVSIARALLKNSPILILDEATSALDSANEIAIQKSLKTAMRGKTTLVIAHRLSTLRNMDRIVVIINGKIVESGSHKQLLRKNGEYKKLWDMQTSGFVA